jgi:hypothetical protein
LIWCGGKVPPWTGLFVLNVSLVDHHKLHTGNFDNSIGP